jgi:DNA-binding response OmpR family regulator
MSAALLVADPEPETRTTLERHLRDDGFDVLGARFRHEALALVEQVRPDLVLAGECSLCERLRAGEPGRTWDRDVPVIVIGPREADAIDRIRAFERGADDYLTRPVVYDELLARIRAILRRRRLATGERLEAGPIVVDQRTRTVAVRERTVRLSRREFELCAMLARDPQRVFTKEELLREVWGIRTRVRTRTLDSHVSRLRVKLSGDPRDRFVVNVWGVGYRLLD